MQSFRFELPQQILMHNITDSGLLGFRASGNKRRGDATRSDQDGPLFFFLHTKAQFTTVSHKSEHI